MSHRRIPVEIIDFTERMFLGIEQKHVHSPQTRKKHIQILKNRS